MRCECCGATEGVGNLARMCPPCFQSLSQMDAANDRLVKCTIHNKLFNPKHDR